MRQAQFGARLHGEWVLDWFHIGMRFQHLVQLAKGLIDSENGQTAANFIKDLLGASGTCGMAVRFAHCSGWSS